jgi:hypothetical protein
MMQLSFFFNNLLFIEKKLENVKFTTPIQQPLT